MSIAIILAFYAPCDYAMPKRHLAQTLDWVSRQGVPAVLAQVVRPGQDPQPTPDGVEGISFESRSVLFHKENLWNLAAGSVSGDKLFFLDADVCFSHPKVIEMADSRLDECDVMQPFETASWEDRTGRREGGKKSAAFALAAGVEPTPAYHPGFAWAMTRGAFDRLGGFYERHPFGGGDTAFAYALDRRWTHSRIVDALPDDTKYWSSPSYRSYQSQASGLGLKVGYLSGVEAVHRWHGDTRGRQYATRCNHVRINRGEEYPLARREDGLLEWVNPEHSRNAQNYFLARREDG